MDEGQRRDCRYHAVIHTLNKLHILCISMGTAINKVSQPRFASVVDSISQTDKTPRIKPSIHEFLLELIAKAWNSIGIMGLG